MSDDSLNRVVIQTIQDMTTALHAVRADVNRAINPLYQRIVEIERRQRDDSQARKEDSEAREARQLQTDAQYSELRDLVESLEARGKVRLRIDVLLLLGIITVIFLLLR